MRIEVATCKESAAANSKTASDDTCAQSVKARVYSSLTAENRSQESAHPAKVAIARLHSPRRVSPPGQSGDSEITFTELLKKLEAEGKIRLPKRSLGKFRAVPSRGKPASQMIIEDRR